MNSSLYNQYWYIHAFIFCIYSSKYVNEMCQSNLSGIWQHWLIIKHVFYYVSLTYIHEKKCIFVMDGIKRTMPESPRDRRPHAGVWNEWINI